MNPEIIEGVHTRFQAADVVAVLAELSRLTLDDVMARSQTNLDNTLMAALHLSDGNLGKLRLYIDAAKVDFRDVIYQAHLRRKDEEA